MLRWLWLSVLVIVFDQISKQLAEAWLALYQPIPVAPSLNFTLMYNTGAAFSFLSSAGGWQRWFFLVLSLVISIILLVWLSRLKTSQRWLAISLALILGGALGNAIDRALFGHVIDFIQVYYQRWAWPTFNIADSAITVGAVLLIIENLFNHSADKDA